MLYLTSGICSHENALDGGHLNVMSTRWGKVGNLINRDFDRSSLKPLSPPKIDRLLRMLKVQRNLKRPGSAAVHMLKYGGNL